MLKIFKKNYANFTEKLSLWFFFLFLITSTLTVRKVLYFFAINNFFNEYTGVYIYLSDILLILTFLFYILCNINSILSNIKSFFTTNKLFHVEHLSYKNLKKYLKLAFAIKADNSKKIVPRGTIALLNKSYTHIINNYYIYFPLLMAFFSFLSIMWTTNWQIGSFRSIKLFEFILLYFYIIAIVPRGTKNENQLSKIAKSTTLFHVEQFSNIIKKINIYCSTWNKKVKFNIVPRGTILEKILIIISITGIIQATIDISQFLSQKSIGFFWLKESIISQSLPGIAKIVINDHAYIRAYGLLPHPNILGGFLVFSIISSLLLLKMFHVEQDSKDNKLQKKCSTWNKKYKNIIAIVPRGTKFTKLLLAIQCIALLLTFSKSAFFGLLIGLFYIKHNMNLFFVTCGTIQKIKMFHVEQYKKIILIIIIALLLVFNSHIIKTETLTNSLTERFTYLKISYKLLLTRPLAGIGAGQFVPSMQNNDSLLEWQYQPVHNVFALIANEYGIFFAIGFIFYLIKIFKNEKCSTWNKYSLGTTSNKKNLLISIYLKGILLSFLFIMLFDHYFWDIQQGQIMLWIILGLLSSRKIHN